MPENPLLAFPPQFAYYRKLLTSDEQRAYDQLADALARLQFTVKLPLLAPDALSRVFTALRYDHPERTFYIDFNTAVGFTCRSLFGGSTTVKVEPLFSPPELRQKLELVAAYTRRIQQRGQALGLCSERELAHWLHDVLASGIHYGGMERPEAFTLLGAVEGEAVCEGIAVLYKYLCSIFGVHSFVVIGHLEGNGSVSEPENNHAWNIVHMGSQNLFVDVTCDLTDTGAPRQDCFARTRAELRATHRPGDLRAIPDITRWQAASV